MKLVVFNSFVSAKIEYESVIKKLGDYINSSSKNILYFRLRNGNEYRFVTQELANSYGKLYPKISADNFNKEVMGMF